MTSVELLGGILSVWRQLAQSIRLAAKRYAAIPLPGTAGGLHAASPRMTEQPETLTSVLHKPRKYRIEPNPMPSRISGMILSLNPWSRSSDSITPAREIALSCFRPTTPAGKIAAFPRKSVRSTMAPTTTAEINSRTFRTTGLSRVRSTSGAPAKTKKKHGRNV